MGGYLGRHVNITRLPSSLCFWYEQIGAARCGAHDSLWGREALYPQGTCILYVPHPSLGLEEKGDRIW